MKVTYDKKIDSKYVKISAGRVAQTKEQEDWLLVDYGVTGNVLGVEILDASKHPMTFSISKKKFFSYFKIPKNSFSRNLRRSKDVFLNMPLEVMGI